MSSKQKPFLRMKFTNGAGNNVFQYAYARLLAEHRDMRLLHPKLHALGMPANDVALKEIEKSSPFETIEIITNSKENPNYHQYFDNPSEKVNLVFKCYPEDFTLYTPVIGRIRKWFPKVPTINQKDLVLHLRMGDRLVMAGSYRNSSAVPAKEFIKAINYFDFERLHIVTDMPYWKPMTVKDVGALTFHRLVAPEKRIDPQASADYWNSLYKALSEFNHIARTGYSVENDFRFMRGFDKILFQHGTFAWWAAALSEASQVGVYGRWRGGKNVNLGWTDLPGWHQWGPVTAPNRSVKEYHLKSLVEKHGLRTFVETGTKGGTTLRSMSKVCDKAYSIELIKPVYEKVCRRFAANPNVRLLHGDSGEKLTELLPEIAEPALFWLDAHSPTESPIIEELKAILSRPFLPHVLVIDDLRYFGSVYPPVQEIKDLVVAKYPKADIDTKYGAIRIFMGGKK